MAKGFDVLHVKSAVKSRNKMDLSRSHLTTANLGEILPLVAEETIPGDQFSVRGDFFSRLAPLVKPTYGKFAFRTASMFIPYHQVAVDADAFFSGKKVWEGITVRQRTISFYSLHRFIVGYLVAPSVTIDGVTVTATASNSVYTYVDTSGTTIYTIFTYAGKYFSKVLNALGYAFPQGVDLQTSSSWMTNVSSKLLSAYPLLAFFKGYVDYMSQSQRYNISPVVSFLKNVRLGVSVSGYSPGTGQLSEVGLATLFGGLFLNYDNDYFTSAWQNANYPLSNYNTTELSSVGVPKGRSESVYSDDESTFLLGSDTNGSYFALSQRALDFLKSFDDWVRRNNYSGSRAVQQIYSRFGIKIDDYRSDYAEVLGTDSLPIQVGDVTATADSTNVPLGDYAGKGIVSGSKAVSLKASDFGLFIIYGYFTVVPMNPYGFDRKVLRVNPLDYYNAEFDGLGADAISVGEYFTNPTVDPSSDPTSDLDVFGFTERYNSYRFGRDMITGEFRNFRDDGDMNVWHSGRLLTSIRQQQQLVAQSSQVNCLEQFQSQYNRIFADTSSYDDHFYLTCKFDFSAIRPMLNLNQVVKLGEGDTAVPRNGNVIS